MKDKNEMIEKNSAQICLMSILVLGILMVTDVFAGEQGHYSPAPMAVRDFVMPSRGTYFINYNTYYHSGTFKDSSGDKFESLSVTGSITRDINLGGQSIPVTITGTTNINFDIKVDVFSQGLGLVHVTDKKILGADYGFLFMPFWGHSSVEVNADADAAGTITVGTITKPFTADTSIKIEDNKTGFGDLFVQPLWFGWHGKQHDVSLSWAGYFPTGAYDKDEIANIGLGFFTSQTQASFYYYPVEDQSTALMFTPTWEWHSKKTDKDVQPGQNITIEYGIGQYLRERFEIGVSGYHQWQITDDAGDAAVDIDVRDSVSGVGGQVTWWAIKEKFCIVGKFIQEYGAKDRLEGQFGEINVTWIF